MRAPGWPSLLAFLFAYLLLQAGVSALRAWPPGQGWIDSFTVLPAAAALLHAAPDEGVQARGARLVWADGSLSVRQGCDGLEVMVLMAAAALVAPLRLRARLRLLLLGVAGVWLLNQGRVLALYAAFRHQPSWFDALHSLWLPLLLVAAAAGFYLWATREPARR